MLRRFDVGHLFLSKRDRDRLAYPPAVEEGGQPPAAEIKFDRSPPSCIYLGLRATRFLRFGGSDGSSDVKVVAVDPRGRALLYDTENCTIRALHSFATPKFLPFSLTVRKNLCVMDSLFLTSIDRDDCFQALIYDHCEEEWSPRSLPPPPYAHRFRNDLYRYHSHVMSYALVGGIGGGGGGTNLWFSKESLGTHCFHVASGSWSKAGAWALPFFGRVEHVPDHGLWFGLTSRFDEEDSVMGAADLTVSPHTARILWKDDLPPQPHRTSDWSQLVYLGRSRFCHVRFFQFRTGGVGCSTQVVFTALEVERRGHELAVVKHRSVRYNVKYDVSTCVL